jgi:hypothetical protein
MSAQPGIDLRDVVVVGAGQGGLAVRLYLRPSGVERIARQVVAFLGVGSQTHGCFAEVAPLAESLVS